MHKRWQMLERYATIIKTCYVLMCSKQLEEREIQLLDRVQSAIAVYQEQLDAEGKERQKRVIIELEERKRLEFEYVYSSE